MKRKVFIETLGCSKNQVDSEIMLGILNENGFDLAEKENEADVIIINTCGFIESAKAESVDTIVDFAELKEEGNCKVLIVSGCLSQRYKDELKKEIPEVDAFLGTTNFVEVAKIVEDVLNDSDTSASHFDIDADVDYELPRVLTSPSYSAYIKISEGCDNRCTYCIIPKLRGKYKSRKMENIIEEVKFLAKNGTKELIIIAQDITRYGLDLYDDYKLVELLDELSKIEGIEWIRLQYSYPDIIDDELISLIARNEKVCDYLDIPIQHCNDDILKVMNRRTSKEHIVNVIKKLRENVPGIAIRTSLIVGFPGETKEQFDELYKFVEEIGFDRLGVFSYSREEDTAAAKLPNQIDEEIKSERQVAIMALQKDISQKKNMAKINSVYDILIEEKVNGEDVYVGRSQYDAPEVDGIVYVNSKDELTVGDFVKVLITDALEYDLIGEVVNESSK